MKWDSLQWESTNKSSLTPTQPGKQSVDNFTWHSDDSERGPSHFQSARSRRTSPARSRRKRRWRETGRATLQPCSTLDRCSPTFVWRCTTSGHQGPSTYALEPASWTFQRPTGWSSIWGLTCSRRETARSTQTGSAAPPLKCSWGCPWPGGMGNALPTDLSLSLLCLLLASRPLWALLRRRLQFDTRDGLSSLTWRPTY